MDTRGYQLIVTYILIIIFVAKGLSIRYNGGMKFFIHSYDISEREFPLPKGASPIGLAARTIDLGFDTLFLASCSITRQSWVWSETEEGRIIIR